MFGFSVVQLARRMGHKLDRGLQRELIQLYHPFRKIPCFLHRTLEYIGKRLKKVPVVIEFHESDEYNLGISQVKGKGHVFHEFPLISCCSGKVSIHKLEQLLYHCPHIKKVHYDRKMSVLLDVASPTLNVPPLNQSGLTGKDVTIAIVDTGIYPHEDLEQRIIGFKDFVRNKTEPYDDNGHGTHCAGDAAGNGKLSNGEYKGPAPEANLVGVKVLDQLGSGSLSTVIAGVNWCIENQSKHNINILSLSLGSDAQQSAEDDPVVKVVEKAWDNGIVVCVAAGNSGPDPKTIASPGISSQVITVGATDDKNTTRRQDDTVADFSSRGPTIDGLTKPDLVTPGTNIISLRAPGSLLDKTAKDSRVDDDYFQLSGTSMATPICAGVAALVIQKNPNLSPDQVKEAMIAGTEDMGLSENIQGHGYLDAQKAIDSTPS